MPEPSIQSEEGCLKEAAAALPVVSLLGEDTYMDTGKKDDDSAETETVVDSDSDDNVQTASTQADGDSSQAVSSTRVQGTCHVPGYLGTLVHGTRVPGTHQDRYQGSLKK